MSMKELRGFVVLGLLSLQISGEGKIMVCKNIENVFSDGEDVTQSNMARLRGPPGKTGPQGLQGLPGLPGLQGIPEKVDYDRISEMIEEKVHQGQHCKEENGLPYKGKCYILPDVSNSHDLSYEQAIQKCNALRAVIAEVHSMAHQQALQDSFELRIPTSRDYNDLAVAMTYQSLRHTLRFRSGKEVPVDQFQWHTGFPRDSGSRVGVQISHRRREGYRWLFNWPTSRRFQGVLCEKNL